MSDSLIMGIIAIPIAIAGTLLVLESGVVGWSKSDKPKRRPHYIRLATFTLVGAVFIGPLFSQPVCPHGITVEAALTPVIGGGIFGAAAELLWRLVRGD
jgi:hypothetical protein